MREIKTNLPRDRGSLELDKKKSNYTNTTVDNSKYN